jgi:hypothetical protein
MMPEPYTAPEPEGWGLGELNNILNVTEPFFPEIFQKSPEFFASF